MKLTRRNALIGLGSLVAGSGALVGTGAFSSVEADRTVSIGISGDNSALLSLNSGTTYNGVTIDGGGSSTPEITITTNSLNENAITKFDGALTVKNAGSNEVNLSVTGVSGTGITFYDSSGNDLSVSGNSVTLTAGASADLGLEIDTSTATTGDVTVTFVAQ